MIEDNVQKRDIMPLDKSLITLRQLNEMFRSQHIVQDKWVRVFESDMWCASNALVRLAIDKIVAVEQSNRNQSYKIYKGVLCRAVTVISMYKLKSFNALYKVNERDWGLIYTTKHMYKILFFLLILNWNSQYCFFKIANIVNLEKTACLLCSWITDIENEK